MGGFIDGSFPIFDNGWFVQVNGAPPGLKFSAYAQCVKEVPDKN